jgi:hypothetical protein
MCNEVCQLDEFCKAQQSEQQWPEDAFHLLIRYSGTCWRLERKLIAFRYCLAAACKRKKRKA